MCLGECHDQVLDALNREFVDAEGRPYRDIRIRHTHILDDPFDDPPALEGPIERDTLLAEGACFTVDGELTVTGGALLVAAYLLVAIRRWGSWRWTVTSTAPRCRRSRSSSAIEISTFQRS